MKKLITLMALFSLCVFAKSENEQKKSCELRISFGSYGSGTPHEVIRKIDAILKENKAKVKSFDSWSWGKEGEVDYCLDFHSKEVLKSVHDEILKVVPLTSKNGYTTILLEGEKTRQTTWPK